MVGFDIKKVEADAIADLAKEQAAVAGSRIKTKLKQIADAERILANLRLEYAALLRDLGHEG